MIQSIKNFFLNIFNKIKAPFLWVWNMPIFAGVRKIILWLWRLLIPALLLGLLFVPIVLTYFPAAKKVNVFNIPKQVSMGNLLKKISVQATVENVFDYDLPVYQDAELKEVLVKQGDTVKAGQVLANLDFVNDTKVRYTDVQNQINTNLTEINNNQDALNKALNLNGANNNQQDTTIRTKTAEWNNINQRRVDKINDINQKKYTYQVELDDYRRQYDNLEANKSVNYSVKQFEDQLRKLQDERSTTTTTVSMVQTQINTAQAGLNDIKRSLSLTTSQACSIYVITTPDLTSTKEQCITAENNLAELNRQALISNSNAGISSGALTKDINDLIYKINQLKKDSSYNGSKPIITDAFAEAQIETKKADFKAKITTRESEIRALENSEEVKTFEDQLKTIERAITDLQAQNSVTRFNDDSTISGIMQRIRTSQIGLEGAQSKYNDTIEDVAKQEKNKTITSKRDGVVGKIYKEQGLVASARDSVFKMVSQDYRLKFKVSADNRGLIKKDMRITTDKFKDLEGIKVSEINIVPNTQAVGAINAAIEYDTYGSLPATNKYTYTQGETVNIDVVIDEKKGVLSVPSTAVFEGNVYVGLGVSNVTTKEIPTDNDNPASDSKTSSLSTAPISAKFKELKQVKIKTGLDDGRNVEVLEGLKAGDYVFSIYPKTPADLDNLKKDNLE